VTHPDAIRAAKEGWHTTGTEVVEALTIDGVQR